MTEIIRIEVASQVVSVPIDKKTLGDFISGLLGQPQTLERVFDSAFSIDHSWLLHLCSLILQRLTQQNAPEPLSFEATINYREGYVRKISSYPAFEHFSETQNIVCVSLRINMFFLIQFPSKAVPERQELILEFKAKETSSSLMESFFNRAQESGKFRIEIRHTERTWADDILHLVSKEFEGVQTKDGDLKNWMRKAFIPYSILLFPVSMMAAIILDLWGKSETKAFWRTRIESLVSGSNSDLQALHQKVDILLGKEREGASGSFGGLFGYDALFAIAMAVAGAVVILAIALARPSPSFIVMSKATENYRNATLVKLKRRNLLLLGSMVLSVVLGVLGNYIYDKIK